MKELKVGERVTITLEAAEIVKGKGCDGCFFDELACNMYDDICKRIKCYRLERKDRKNVQFKRVK